MPHEFQVGDLVRVKRTHIEGTNDRGKRFPTLGPEFGISSFDDPDNLFEVIDVKVSMCGGNHNECKRKHGCLGPLVSKKVTTGKVMHREGVCLGYGAGYGFEIADPPEFLKELEELGIECSSENVRFNP